MASKLYIYDASSGVDRRQASGRFSGAEVTTLAAASVADLHQQLTGYIARRVTFTRILFQTHGYPGMIFFNHEAIDAGVLRSAFVGRGYEQLFPARAKVYFDGCNVAESEDGWDFLTAAGEAFLRSRGGISMGWTSAGFGLPGWFPFIGGHTVHFTGDIRYIDFAPGPQETSRFDSDGATADARNAAMRNLENF